MTDSGPRVGEEGPLTLRALRNLLNPLRRRQIVFCNPTDHPLVEGALRELRKEGYEIAAKPHRYVDEGTAIVADADVLDRTLRGPRPFARPSTVPDSGSGGERDQ